MHKSQFRRGDLEIAAMTIFCIWAGSLSPRIMVGPSFNNLSTVPEGLNFLSLCLFHPGWLSRHVFCHFWPCQNQSGEMDSNYGT